MPALRDLPAVWRARPPAFSRRVWALALLLDRLPWPWGEEILGVCFLARAFVRTARLRQALAWASARTQTRRDRWRLARTLCTAEGRSIARFAFVGIRDLDSWARQVTVRGAEHLEAAGRGAILLNFHLGPISSSLALIVEGHRLTWVGGENSTRMWSREIRERFPDTQEDLAFTEPDRMWRWASLLYRARRVLLDGGSIMINADGGGREAFAVPLAGGSAVIREGWLALRRATGAPVLPVLSHLEGRLHVVTIHPPLPALCADRAGDLEACRRTLAEILGEYVRRYPDQCYVLAFTSP